MVATLVYTKRTVIQHRSQKQPKTGYNNQYRVLAEHLSHKCEFSPLEEHAGNVQVSCSLYAMTEHSKHKDETYYIIYKKVVFSSWLWALSGFGRLKFGQWGSMEKGNWGSRMVKAWGPARFAVSCGFSFSAVHLYLAASRLSPLSRSSASICRELQGGKLVGSWQGHVRAPMRMQRLWCSFQKKAILQSSFYTTGHCK